MADPSTPASDPAPPRPNDLDDPACLTVAQPVGNSGKTGRPATPVAPRDPRAARQLSPRDLQALVLIATFGILTQGQLHEALFRGLSEVVVSRCVKRLRTLGLIDATRWNRIGVNVLRLTTAGRTLLLEQGTAEDRLFTSRWPTPSGFAHRLWVADTAIALERLGNYRVQTCWQLRRRLAGTQSPVLDLLARSVSGSRLLAIEIDVGTENLKKFVVPRVSDLDAALSAWNPGGGTGILFLTAGERRAESLRRQLPPTTAVTAVELLPRAVGRAAIDAIVEVFTRA